LSDQFSSRQWHNSFRHLYGSRRTNGPLVFFDSQVFRFDV
jgi:hypothetical protein